MNPVTLRERLAAAHADAVAAALRGSVQVQDLVDAWFRSHAQAPDTPVDARSWVKAHALTDPNPLRKALTAMYGDGWVLGERIALASLAEAAHLDKVSKKDALVALATDWDTWKPGHAAAASLTRPKNGLRSLLDARSTVIKGIFTTTLDRIGTVLADGLDAGWNVSQTAKALLDVLADPQRAVTIARTELASAMSVASRGEYRDAGVEQVEWLVADPCDVCAENEDASPLPIDTAFPSGDTEPPAHPNCFPPGTFVHGPNLEGATSRQFDGEVVELVFGQGSRFTVTPNHPILTPHGWIAAGELKVGDQVLSQRGFERASTTDVYNDDVPALIEQVVEAFSGSGGVSSAEVPVSAPDFHGDGAGSDVAVVWSDRRLLVENGQTGQHAGDICFESTDTGLQTMDSRGSGGLFVETSGSPSDGGVGRSSIGGPLLGSVLARSEDEAFLETTNGDSGLDEPQSDSASGNAVLVGEDFLGNASEVFADDLLGWEITAVKFTGRHYYSGLVFNLQTVRGWYYADGIIVHNCMCSLAPYVVDTKGMFSDKMVKGVLDATNVTQALARLEVLPNPTTAVEHDPGDAVETPWRVVPVPTVDPGVWDTAEITLVPLRDLVATNPYQLRKKVARHIEAMGQSLSRNRSYPLLYQVGDTTIIMDGHHRLMAMWLLGLSTVPVWLAVADEVGSTHVR